MRQGSIGFSIREYFMLQLLHKTRENGNIMGIETMIGQDALGSLRAFRYAMDSTLVEGYY